MAEQTLENKIRFRPAGEKKIKQSLLLINEHRTFRSVFFKIKSFTNKHSDNIYASSYTQNIKIKGFRRIIHLFYYTYLKLH